MTAPDPMQPLTLLHGNTTAETLRKETLRVYEICDGCRRCFNLCPSFNTLLDRVDQHEGDVGQLASGELREIADQCYYCKLCYNHCPYTPPHQYQLDFPQLMVAWKRHIHAEGAGRWRDKLLVRTDLLGKLGSACAPLVNRLLRAGWIRWIADRLLGLHRHRHVLPFARETFPLWWRRRAPHASGPSRGKVALFSGCLVNYQAVDIGKACVQVLEKNHVEVVVPPHQCCGMPSFDLGDVSAIQLAAEANAKRLLPLIEQGYDVVVPVPSCSLMLKREYPRLMPGAGMATLSERTFDICEYLMRLKRRGGLATDFVTTPGRIAYHVPCHLRDQNIGFKSKELMELTGAEVEAVERCSGHDGAWSAKSEFFVLSMSIARKAVRDIEQVNSAMVASDCPLAALQLDQAGGMAGSSRPATRHPIQIIRDAYGLPA